jgi:D-arabinose 1-dehydrogenase-like Zn-dependent alcohol dehydrogenase
MKTKAVRLYGVNDLRLETFELPEIGDDGVRVEVVSDSICMSSYKAALQGAAHKRVPDDIATNPVIIGHEFCGRIVEVGKKLAEEIPRWRQCGDSAGAFLQGVAARAGVFLPLLRRRRDDGEYSV